MFGLTCVFAVFLFFYYRRAKCARFFCSTSVSLVILYMAGAPSMLPAAESIYTKCLGNELFNLMAFASSLSRSSLAAVCNVYDTTSPACALHKDVRWPHREWHTVFGVEERGPSCDKSGRQTHSRTLTLRLIDRKTPSPPCSHHTPAQTHTHRSHTFYVLHTIRCLKKTPHAR